jgi:hypothetical protein
MRCSVAVVLPLLIAAAACPAGEAAFTAKPTVAKDGDKTKIAFTVSAPTDVEVAVLDKDGKVVRHLVAGVLGGQQPPPEPLKAGLSQSLEWDGKDDSDKPAGGGPFKVRVSAGMKPAFDGFLLENPAATWVIHALTVGSNGQVYLFAPYSTTTGFLGAESIKVLSREGKYVRTVAPFPANIAPEKVKALGAFQTPSGEAIPRVHHYTFGFYPVSCAKPAGSSPAVDSRGRLYWVGRGPVLVALDADGGVSSPTYAGPALFPDIKDLALANKWQYGTERPALAVSGDEKHVYLSGLNLADLKNPRPVPRPVPCVFRVNIETRGPAEPFVGTLGQPGTEKGLLTAPRGLAVAKGLLFVGDRGADRIVVFNEADRAYVGEVKVKAPDTIAVDPATEAIYVCSVVDGQKPSSELVKIENYRSGKELYRLSLAKMSSRLAVDVAAKPVRIWAAVDRWAEPGGLACIEDAGDKFAIHGDPRPDVAKPWAIGPHDLSVDRVRNELYVKINFQKWHRLDEPSGRFKDTLALPGVHMSNMGTQLITGPDGNLYSHSWDANGVQRWDHSGKPVNWPGRDTHTIPLTAMMSYQARSLAVIRPDEFITVPPPAYRPTWDGKAKIVSNPISNYSSLNVFGTDGQLKRTLIWQCTMGATPKFDLKGNLYLGEMIKPPDRSYPEFFDGKLAVPGKQCDSEGASDIFYNSYLYGSIIKFPPEGGIIWYKNELPPTAKGQPSPELLAKPKIPVQAHLGYNPHVKTELQGALWYRFGYSPFTITSTTSGDSCMCEACGFDVDPYGRVFFPNLQQFRVEIVDTNNNPITTAGEYGNPDSGGPNALVPKPAIPLAWAQYVAVSDTHIYVADRVNSRVVRIKMTRAAEETCEVR